jgi:NAD+ diphosphatase
VTPPDARPEPVGTRPDPPDARPEPLTGLALSRAAVDRAAHHRADPQWLAAAWDDGRTGVLRLSTGRVAVGPDEDGHPTRLDLAGRPDVPQEERFFLGVAADGTAYFAVDVGERGGGGDHAAGWLGLRELAPMLDDRSAGLLVHAVSLANWHATHRFCPRCGGPTRPENAGHTRRCDRDASEHHPRTDPAVIMSVVDTDDRILLGRQVRWPEGRFSTLAGFVEPGESLEAAVRREVGEEVGLRVGRVDYLGSQPWPFPSSLMLGFRAHAETVEVDRFDGEIAEARWFSRAGLAAAIAAGEVRPSPSVSISRRLIEHWYGGSLDHP